jgi:hypothetical protein
MAIQLQIGVMQSGVSFMEAAADQRSDAGKKFGKHEGLSQIIIGAGVQAFDALLDESARGEHHDGRFDSALAQFAADFDSTYAWEAHV